MLLVAGLVCMTSSAWSTNLLTNPSFEAPDMGGDGDYGFVIPTDWDGSGCIALEDPPDDGSWGYLATDGDQVVTLLYADTYIEQAVGTIQADTKYVFTADILPWSPSDGATNGYMYFQAFDGDSTWTELATSANFSTAKTWGELGWPDTFTVQFESSLSPQYNGQTLYVGFKLTEVPLGGGVSDSSRSFCSFDKTNVVVVAGPIEVVPISLDLIEGGTPSTYEIVLTQEPNADVQIIATPSNVEIDLGNGPGQAKTLTFTTSNWNTAQTVTIAAVDDENDTEGPHTSSISHQVSSEDPDFNNTAVSSITVNIEDNYTPLVIAPINDDLVIQHDPYTGPTPTLLNGSGPDKWVLVEGPDGMVIDEKTGVVSWADPTPMGSPYLITIRATNFPTIPPLIKWVENRFGQTKHYGATSIREQDTWAQEMGSHTARYASVVAKWFGVTADPNDREEARAALAMATYSAYNQYSNPWPPPTNGGYGKGINYTGIGHWYPWFSDSYWDYMSHILGSMVEIPEIVPPNENHILGTTSLITDATYSPNQIEYETYDPDGTEILRLTFEPRVLADSQPLPTWQWSFGDYRGVSRILRIHRFGVKHILIEQKAALPPLPPEQTFTQPDKMPGYSDHNVVLDTQGKLVPWASYSDIIQWSMNFIKNCPMVASAWGNDPWYLVTSCFNANGTFQRNQNTQGSFSYWAVETLKKYYAYTGDRDAFIPVQKLLDRVLYYHTPPAWAWPNVPRTQDDNTGGAYIADGVYNDKRSGVDKICMVGVAYVNFYKLTGEEKYLNAAKGIADTVSQHVQPGDATHSPLPFRVLLDTGEVVDPYTSNMTYAVMLFDELCKLNYCGQNNDFQAKRNIIWQWIRQYPFKNNQWSGYYEDVYAGRGYDPNEGYNNMNQQAPMETARFILDRPENALNTDVKTWLLTVNWACGNEDYPLGDVDRNCKVDLKDFAFLASQWLNTECTWDNNWCDYADVDASTEVDFGDIYLMTQNWLQGVGL